MNEITINGKTIISNGSIVISNGKILVGGVDCSTEEKVINIHVEGNIEKLEVDVCEKISVTGSCHTVLTHNGDVNCHDVTHYVTTHNGNVDCQNVGGAVTTHNGNIKHKK